MKHLFLAIMSMSLSYAQSAFEFNQNGFTDFIVVDVPGTSNEIYSKSINWVKENFKNPEKVILMQIENEKMRIEGHKEQFSCVKSMGANYCSDAKFQIEISFKDGKFKFDPTSLLLINSAGNSFDVPLNNVGPTYYNKKGNLKSGMEGIDKSFEDFFNGLSESLKSYIVDGGKKNDNW